MSAAATNTLTFLEAVCFFPGAFLQLQETNGENAQKNEE